MGLQVWLPLNGDFKDNGLANASLTTSGSWSTISKIGTKGFTNGTITMSAADTGRIYNNRALTFSFWIYVNAATGTYYAEPITGNSNMYGSNNRKFTTYIYDTVNCLHLSWQNDGAEGVNPGTFTGSGALECLPSYQWTHVAITYANPKAILYINGEEYTAIEGVSDSASFAYSTPIVKVGNYHIVNDFRIYDHCCSAREIAEIAKGLAVHYPLNNNGLGANLLLDSNVSVTNASWPTAAFLPKPYLTQGETYTLTMCVTPGAGTTHFNPHLSQGYVGIGNMPVSGTNMQIISKTFTASYYSGKTPADSEENAKMRIYRYPNTLTTQTTVHWVVITKGSTPVSNWTPHYNDIFDASTEYDCSGFGYDATLVGNFIYTSDTKKYDCAPIFDNATTYATTPIKDLMTNLLANQCTINFWANEGSTSSRSIYLGGYNGSGFNIEENSGQFRVYWNGSPNIQIASSVTAGQWTMWTVVINKNTGIKIYKNAALLHTHSAALSTVPTSGTFYLGRDYRAASDDVWLEGSMSDFRIYATALSDEAILDMYKVPVSVADTGTIFGAELKEV